MLAIRFTHFVMPLDFILYEAGTDLMTIKEAMGHKSLSSTSVYLTLGIGNGRSVTSPYDV